MKYIDVYILWDCSQVCRNIRRILSLSFQGKGHHIISSIWSLFLPSFIPLILNHPFVFLAEQVYTKYTSTIIKVPLRQTSDVKIILNFELRSIYFVTLIAEVKSLRIWCMIYIFTWTCHLFPYIFFAKYNT